MRWLIVPLLLLLFGAGCQLLEWIPLKPVSGKFYDVTLESRYDMAVVVETGRHSDLKYLDTEDGPSRIMEPGEVDRILSLANKNYVYYLFQVHELTRDEPVISELVLTYSDLEERGWHVVLGP